MMPADSYSRRVLVLDGVPETAEVLQAVLQPRGIQVMRESSRSSDFGGTDVDLVVVHRGESADEPRCLDLPRTVPQIVVDCGLGQDDAPGYATRLSSPFQYGDLVREIELLLGGERA